MKQILWLLLAVVVVFSGCLEPKTGGEDVSETTEEVVTVEEMQTMVLEETTIVEMIEESATEEDSNEPKLTEEFKEELAEKALKLLNDLIVDFDNTVGKINFESDKQRDYMIDSFNIRRKLISVSDKFPNIIDKGASRIFWYSKQIHVMLVTKFTNWDTYSQACVVFTENNGEWAIINVYDSTNGH